VGNDIGGAGDIGAGPRSQKPRVPARRYAMGRRSPWNTLGGNGVPGCRGDGAEEGNGGARGRDGGGGDGLEAREERMRRDLVTTRGLRSG